MKRERKFLQQKAQIQTFFLPFQTKISINKRHPFPSLDKMYPLVKANEQKETWEIKKRNYDNDEGRLEKVRVECDVVKL